MLLLAKRVRTLLSLKWRYNNLGKDSKGPPFARCYFPVHASGQDRQIMNWRKSISHREDTIALNSLGI